jgi:hypothetical protein
VDRGPRRLQNVRIPMVQNAKNAPSGSFVVSTAALHVPQEARIEAAPLPLLCAAETVDQSDQRGEQAHFRPFHVFAPDGTHPEGKT